MPSPFLLLVLAGIALGIARRIWAFRNKIKSLHHLAGERLVFNPFGAFTFVTKVEIPLVSAGRNSLFERKHDDFVKYGCDIISCVTMLSTIRGDIRVADAEVIKEITANRARFPKPVQHYGILSIYGRNIVASEDEEWKKFRKVSAPSFSERNNRLVWNETLHVMKCLFEQVWGPKERVTVDNTLDLTLAESLFTVRHEDQGLSFNEQITLFIISAAGFGRRISWSEEQTRPAGYHMSFKETLVHVSENVRYKLLLPKFIVQLGLTQRLRDIKVAFPELEKYMLDMIRERRTVKAAERYDLFSGLLDANEKDFGGHAQLTDNELMGNIFIFLLAGHETTAHSLAFALGLLALHPDIQEELYQHIQSVHSKKNSFEYEDVNAYSLTIAVFLETLRMFPSVVGIPKGCTEDTTFYTAKTSGQRVPVTIPKGTGIVIHTPGLHYNPRYWEDPHTFHPSRFLRDWPRDAFIPFSAGPRACLGKRFSETEAVAVLNMLVSQYKIEVKDEPQFAAETWEQRKARVLGTDIGITLTPTRIPLTFIRRA